VEFSNPFEIHFDREETCHALVAYFTVDFSACSKPTRFSTGPKSRATHWKQTVFYLQEPVTVRRGDALRGTITVRRNARNPRDLDIDLEGALEGSHAYSMRQSYRLR
jgi:protein arginine N-methyltransferase 1